MTDHKDFLKHMLACGYKLVARVPLILYRDLAPDIRAEAGPHRLRTLARLTVIPSHHPRDFEIRIGWRPQRAPKKRRGTITTVEVSPLQGQLFALRPRSPYAGVITPIQEASFGETPPLEVQELWLFSRAVARRKKGKKHDNVIDLHHGN